MEQNCEIDLENPKRRELKKGLIHLVLFLGVMLLIRCFLFLPYWIPSGSMKPTMLVGDYILVDKRAYGVSHASCPSIPFLGLTSKDLCGFLDDGDERRFGTGPERGDIAVFRHKSTDDVLVKRVIGLPGDRIQVKDGIVQINGEPAPQVPGEVFREAYAPQGSRGNMPACKETVTDEAGVRQCLKDGAVETLPNGVTHGVLDLGDMEMDNTAVYTVPMGSYFMMGDNRDNSMDSRFQDLRGPGFVKATDIVGKARYVVFSSAGDRIWKFWTWRKDRFWHEYR